MVDVARAAAGIELSACARKLERRAVRHDVDRLRGAGADLHEQALGGLGHHDHALGLVAERRQHLELVRRRLREHRVQRHDERLRELAREREHVLAVLAAEDAVLVLEQHDVDVGAAERAGGANVVAARPLRDGAQDLRPLRARRLVDDDELADVVDVRDVRATPSGHRRRKCQSRMRAVETSKRSRYARSVRPFRQMPEARVRTTGWIG